MTYDYIIKDNRTGSEIIIEENKREEKEIRIVRQQYFKENVKSVFDEVYNGDPVLIPRKGNENIVLISEKRYRELTGERSAQLERLRKYSEMISQLSEGNAITDGMKIETVGDLKKAIQLMPEGLEIELIIKKEK